jgi:hypothetical protein
VSRFKVDVVETSMNPSSLTDSNKPPKLLALNVKIAEAIIAMD